MLVGSKSQNHPQQTRYSGSKKHVDDRALPQSDFDVLFSEFKFSIDVAASSENTKCKRFITEAENGLVASWAGERVYCNPPYSDISPWIRKAWEERQAEIIVMLLPANRTEQTWWKTLVEPYRDKTGTPLTTRFLPGRLRFLKPGQTEIGPNERPPFGCVLLVWKWKVELLLPEGARFSSTNENAG